MYTDGDLVEEGFDVRQLAERRAKPGAVLWVDVCRPDRGDLDELAEELSLHELAVEDATTMHERPKLDRYPTHLLLVAYQTRYDASAVELDRERVTAFILPDVLVTVRTPGFDLEAMRARWDSNARLERNGVGFLLHGLLDHVVDSHVQTVQDLDDAIEGLEDLLFADRPVPGQVQRRCFALRRVLADARRVALPMREVLNTLMRRDLHVVDDATMLYLQDVYDHVLRVSEWTEGLRDMVATVLETNLTIQGNQLNVIMKQLTGWAAVIAVPTAVTGFFGQNVAFPGFGHWSAFIISSLAIVALSVALYTFLRHRDWI